MPSTASAVARLLPMTSAHDRQHSGQRAEGGDRPQHGTPGLVTEHERAHERQVTRDRSTRRCHDVACPRGPVSIAPPDPSDTREIQMI